MSLNSELWKQTLRKPVDAKELGTINAQPEEIHPLVGNAAVTTAVAAYPFTREYVSTK